MFLFNINFIILSIRNLWSSLKKINLKLLYYPFTIKYDSYKNV